MKKLKIILFYRERNGIAEKKIEEVAFFFLDYSFSLFYFCAQTCEYRSKVLDHTCAQRGGCFLPPHKVSKMFFYLIFLSFLPPPPPQEKPCTCMYWMVVQLTNCMFTKLDQEQWAFNIHETLCWRKDINAT